MDEIIWAEKFLKNWFDLELTLGLFALNRSTLVQNCSYFCSILFVLVKVFSKFNQKFNLKYMSMSFLKEIPVHGGRK